MAFCPFNFSWFFDACVLGCVAPAEEAFEHQEHHGLSPVLDYRIGALHEEIYRRGIQNPAWDAAG
jgi:hypothetical protein